MSFSPIAYSDCSQASGGLVQQSFNIETPRPSGQSTGGTKVTITRFDNKALPTTSTSGTVSNMEMEGDGMLVPIG